MAAIKNPFPGMNPFLESAWLDVHTKLIAYISDALAQQLPTDLVARTEEKIEIDDLSELTHHRADVAVTETWRQGHPPSWQPQTSIGGTVATAVPEIIEIETGPERWVEIRSRQGTVITIIEVLSPWNKQGTRLNAYREKQRRYLETRVNLVEIDLLRGGQHVISAPRDLLKPHQGARCLICCTRGTRPNRHEVYSCPLRDPLPIIAIPLRPTDADIPLDLQPLIDRCYEMGRHDTNSLDFTAIPSLEAEDEAWVLSRLKESHSSPDSSVSH